MSFVPVLWNRNSQRQNDSDDMFSFLDDWSPLSWGYGRPMMAMQRRRRPENSLADRKWTYSVKIGDFNAEHVKVKVDDGKVIIHAKYTDGNDEWGDTVERTRTVQIPENVDAEKIHSFMKSDGTMMLEAPYRLSEEKQLQVVPQEGRALVSSDSHNNLMTFSVDNYRPEEVKVTCKDGMLTAQGERQRSEDGHEIRESFFRQMTVPRSVDGKNIQCFRDDKGNLTIRAPMAEDVEMEQAKK
ncbi:major egg antigen-like [Mytilus trossulus]|uniref:major egg antigen-like n=1 Tax=Mytilus trossulus TaxID=6551 RepID=UPI0030062010